MISLRHWRVSLGASLTGLRTPYSGSGNMAQTLPVRKELFSATQANSGIFIFGVHEAIEFLDDKSSFNCLSMLHITLNLNHRQLQRSFFSFP